jgi:hypothetical protein
MTSCLFVSGKKYFRDVIWWAEDRGRRFLQIFVNNLRKQQGVITHKITTLISTAVKISNFVE